MRLEGGIGDLPAQSAARLRLYRQLGRNVANDRTVNYGLGPSCRVKCEVGFLGSGMLRGIERKITERE